MERRIFLKQAAMTAAAVAYTGQTKGSAATPTNPIARRTLGTVSYTHLTLPTN